MKGGNMINIKISKETHKAIACLRKYQLINDNELVKLVEKAFNQELKKSEYYPGIKKAIEADKVKTENEKNFEESFLVKVN